MLITNTQAGKAEFDQGREVAAHQQYQCSA